MIKRIIGQAVDKLLIPLNLILKSRKIAIVCRDGSAPGDHLILTTLVEFLKKEYNYKSYVITTFPEFFQNNPSIIKIINRRTLNPILKRILDICMYSSTNSNIILSRYKEIDNLQYEDYMRKTQSKLHLREIALKHTPHFNKIKNKDLNIKIYFSKEEEKEFSKKYKDIINKKYVLTHSQAKTSYTLLKDWGFENFQELVKSSKKYNWVQIGAKDDKELRGTFKDLRGIPFREFFFILKYSKAIVCTEGFLTHSSSAFNISCINIFGNFSPIELARYKNIIPIEPRRKKGEKVFYSWSNTKNSSKKDIYAIKSISPKRVIEELNKLKI